MKPAFTLMGPVSYKIINRGKKSNSQPLYTAFCDKIGKKFGKDISQALQIEADSPFAFRRPIPYIQPFSLKMSAITYSRFSIYPGCSLDL